MELSEQLCNQRIRWSFQFHRQRAWHLSLHPPVYATACHCLLHWRAKFVCINNYRSITYLHRWWQLVVWYCRRFHTDAHILQVVHADKADRASWCRIRQATDKCSTLPALPTHSLPGPSFQVSICYRAHKHSYKKKNYTFYSHVLVMRHFYRLPWLY